MHQLTRPQKLIYDMEKYAGGSIATVCGSIVIEGNKGITEITNAVNDIYRINDALRIRITETNGVPYQYVIEYQKQAIDVLRFKNKAELDSYAQKFAREPFDFYGSLCDIKVIMLDDSYGILVKLHHIISDAWTLTLLGSQFAKILEGNTPEAYSYLDYINEEENYLSSKRYEKDREYYIDRFKKCDEVTYISDKQVSSYEATRKTFIVEADKTEQLRQYAEKHNTSLFMLFMTSLGVYINRIKMNEENFYVGTAVLNRSGLKEQNTVGMFINTVPFLFELENESTFAENLENAANASMSIFRHQKFNYGDILKTLRSEFNFSGNLYDVMLSYQNAKITGAKDKFETTWYSCGMQTESLQIHIDDRDSEGILKIHYDYQTEKFTENEIEKMHEHIFNLLFDAIENDNKKIYELEILSQSERNILLYEFNDTKADYPKDKCVHQLFEEQVLKIPDKTAVIACDKTLTYNELNCLANRIAHGLIAKGVKPNDIVAFALPRNSYLIPVIFGILKSGAAYMPIDPDYPQDRIDYMLEDSKAKIFITDNNLNDYISDDETTKNIRYVLPNKKYCIIYTSGSTGMPKGCILLHKGIVNFCISNNVVNWAEQNNIDLIGTSINNVTFDYFIAENIVLLIRGYTTVLCNENEAINSALFKIICKKNKVNIVQTTPTKYKILFGDSKLIEQFKIAVTSGEPLNIELLDLLKTSKETKVFNPLGPSECSVWNVGGELI